MSKSVSSNVRLLAQYQTVYVSFFKITVNHVLELLSVIHSIRVILPLCKARHRFPVAKKQL